ncbi:MAG TPA: NAD(P)H-quinone oxidoreductase [Pyrinomonadaceae bacterium]|nr:NAD(P)H-quinone oxidoreductase [Pyrinomonadaceae bacterium]
MKAVVITAPGGPDVLDVREVPAPELQNPDSIRVKVHAAALNRADILQRRGLYPAPPGYPQDIPGMEFAGEVETLGRNVTQWKTGQRVFGITGAGAQAEYVVVPASSVAEIPPNLDWPEAGAVPEVFVTAHDALFTRANLQAGENVLVHAAGSGVGLAAIQLARACGANVFGTSRTSEKLERAKPFGLSGSFTAGNDPLALVSVLRTWSEGRGVDVVLELVGAPYLEANLQALAQKGRIVLVGMTGGSRVTLDLLAVMQKRATLVGTVLRSRSDEEKAEAISLFAEQVVPLLASGEVKPVIDRVYKLEEVRQAHRRMEANENFGKIVLVI